MHIATRQLRFWFPSLSGKTSIRTITFKVQLDVDAPKVSIPFREDLYSDRTSQSRRLRMVPDVSIPFREDLYSDIILKNRKLRKYSLCFHPFQGRPLFGQDMYDIEFRVQLNMFPSLSGKTSIRTSHQGRVSV